MCCATGGCRIVERVENFNKNLRWCKDFYISTGEARRKEYAKVLHKRIDELK